MRLVLFLCYIMISASAYAAQALIDDEVETVIKQIAKPIYQAAGLGNMDLEVRILKDDAINAFVADSKHIYINSGLITFSDNPEVIMGVIAHECGHIALGHLGQRDQLMQNANHQMITTFLLGAAAGVLGSPEATIGIMMGGSHVATANILSHSRQHELEADRAALKYLNKAKFSPQGLLELLKHLNTNERIFFKDINPYMITHPVSKDRIERIHEHSEHNDGKISDDLKAAYKMIYAKMFAFLNPPQKTFKQFSGNQPADIYAQAIAYYRKGTLAPALEKIDYLLKTQPKNPYYLELKAQFLYENGKIADSIIFYQKALDNKPRSLSMKIELAASLISSNQASNLRKAEHILEQVVEIEADNYTAWRALGIALAKNNKPALSNIALAQSMLIAGDIKAAQKFISRISTVEEKNVSKRMYKDILLNVKERDK